MSIEGGMDTEHHEEKPLDKVKKRKTEISSKNPTPSANEMNELRETENIFNSSLFSLQITELLKEAKISQKKQKAVEATLTSLKQIFDSLQTQQVASTITSVYPGLPLANAVSDLAFEFRGPEKVAVIGSFLLGNHIRSSFVVDIAVTIPPACIKDKDIQDHRYFSKRTLYLAVIAQALETNFSSIQLEPFRGDIYKPILTFKSPSNANVTFRVFPALRPTQFGVAKLFPTKGHVGTESTPTPQYNNAIVEDMFMESHTQLIHSFCSQSKGFSQAIVLFKVWLKQRNMLSSDPEAMTGFILSMFLVHLCQTGLVHMNMSAYDVFCFTLRQLKVASWRENGIVMKPNSGAAPELVEEFRQAFPIVFVDPSGRVNLTSRMSEGSFADFLHDVDLTLHALQSSSRNQFQKIFMSPITSAMKYDATATITDARGLGFKTSAAPVTYATQLYHPSPSVEEVINILQKGYTNRIKYLQVLTPTIPPWDLNQPVPKPPSAFGFGLIFNQLEFGRLVDQGPSAEDESAVAIYKHLWGSKTQIRRFREGGVVAAVVWENSARSLECRHCVVRDIGVYLVNLHFPQFSPKSKAVRFHMGLYDKIVIPDIKLHVPSNTTAQAASVSAHGVILERWNALSKIIVDLSGLPLAVRGTANISSVYRYSDIDPPCPNALLGGDSDYAHPSRPYVKPIEGTTQFVSSGAWPSDLKSIAATKQAFYLAVGRALKKQHQIQTNATRSYLDVYYSGYVFRFTIFHPREIFVASPQATALTDDEIDQILESAPTAESKSAFEQYQDTIVTSPIYATTILRPQLASMIHGLYLKSPSFGPCARLFFHWLSSHMLDDQFSDEAVELLASAVYTDSDNVLGEKPNHYFAGFCRILHLLVTWDWASEPLIVNFDGDLTPEDYHKIQNRFESMSNIRCSLFIAYKGDMLHSQWTTEKPSPIVFSRVQHFARETLKLIQKQFSDLSVRLTTHWDSLFQTTYLDYDLLLKMKPEVLPRLTSHLSNDLLWSKQSKKFARVKEFKNLHGNTSTGLLVGFDPHASFYHELHERFGTLGMLFHNKFGNVIGIIWNPISFLIQSKFSPHQSINTMPITSPDDNEIVGFIPNITAIIQEIQLMGKGILDKIEIPKGQTKLV